MRTLFTCALIVSLTALDFTTSRAATTDSAAQVGEWQLGAFLDVYYSYQFNRPASGDIPYFVSSNRHNEFSVNLAYLDLKYNNDLLRMHFIPAFGGYMDANYASESGSFKHFVEANIGVKPFKNKSIWLDAGVLPSPFSTETAISKDQPMYTRSLAPEYVPYYLSGLKCSLPLNKHLNAGIYVVNGWQNIKDNNANKSVIMQLDYSRKKHQLISNVYVGQEQDINHPSWRQRQFYDFQWLCKINKSLTTFTCVYLGQQQQVDSVNQLFNSQWWQANTVLKWQCNKTTFLSFRAECFKDMSCIQIQPLNQVPGAFLYGSGICYNRLISHNAMFRLDFRTLNSPYAMFTTSSGYGIKSSQSITANLSAWF